MADDISFSQLAKDSWHIFKSKLGLFLSLSFVFYYLPVLIAGLYRWNRLRPKITAGWELTLSNYLQEAYWMVPISIIVWLTKFFLMISIIYVVAMMYKNSHISFSQALRETLPYYGKALLLQMLLIIMLLPLYLLLILPGIIYSWYWLFSFNALVIDDCSVKQSKDSSKRLVKGRIWKIVSVYFKLFLLILAISLVVKLVLLTIFIIWGVKSVNLGVFLVNALISNLVEVIAFVYTIIFITRYYIYLRSTQTTTQLT